MGKFQKLQRELEKKEEVEDEVDVKGGSDSDSSSSDEDSVQGGEVDASVKKEPLWKNRERVLVFCSRGVDYRVRHLMNDLKTLMPHTKGESKFDKSTSLPMINEIAEMKNCSKVLYFENRKRQDNYLWMSNVGEGPSMKFLVHNVHTLSELKMSGNCLKASRPVLSFDSAFDEKPYLSLIKQSLMQIFATPDHHPRSQPFVDHVFSFTVAPDRKIWFRNFQIVDKTLQLQEIGPRFVLELIRIFEGSFEGTVLYDNPEFLSPNKKRSLVKLEAQSKYANKKLNEKMREAREIELKSAMKSNAEDPVGELFNTDSVELSEEAKKIAKRIDEPIAKKRKMKQMKAKKGVISGEVKKKIPKYQ